ncbi:MAG: M28 family peptidase, partial [Chloroflexota bacterium]|nr:M28 family peptidase [Chloroflexota bacterium]
TGSRGNRMATDIFAEVVTSYGFRTECPEFDCIDWTHGDVHITVDGELFEAFVSPYSLSCHLNAPLTIASTVEELEAVDTSGKIALLRGHIAKEQLMPKNFPFYNPDRHKKIIHLLETKAPVAIIAATSRNPETAGGVYPFPLIEDGDFDIPSVYMTQEEGDRLAEYTGKAITLTFNASRIPSTGCNVIARKGSDAGHRIVLCAHIDAKEDTPGALDNATGIVVLLLLAELMGNYSGRLGIEIVAFNGEDYYCAPGQVQYVGSNEDKFHEVILGINLDGAGYREGNTAYSLYNCPVEITSSIQRTFSYHEDIVEGEQWFQSDHMIFVLNERPALAITSERFVELSTYITHTDKDGPELVDRDKLVNIALALRSLILEIEDSLK